MNLQSGEWIYLWWVPAWGREASGICIKTPFTGWVTVDGKHKAVLEGSQHSRFNLSFSDWKVDGLSLEVNHQVEIIAGRHCYQGLVTYSGTEEKLALVTGIVNIKSHQLHVVELDNNHTGFLTHDFQAEDSSKLAMALVVPNSYLKSYGETKRSLVKG